MLLVEKENLLRFIPQRPPMVMVDALTSSDDASQTAWTEFKITPENIFCENGVFTEPGLIENIAQSCALRAGYSFHSKNEAVPLGFIGAVKNLIINELPAVDSTIKTEIQVVNEIFDVTLVNGKIYCNQTLIASCEMKIFLKKD